MTKSQLIREMLGLDPQRDREQLARLSRQLITRRANPGMEKLRFEGTVRRPIPGYCRELLGEQLGQARRVLVTGGTGCVGRVVLSHLAKDLRGAELASLARRPPATPIEGVTYFFGDIRRPERVHEVVRAVSPDLIVHLAAQRDPSRAEVDVAETVSTNVAGSANVLEAAGTAGVPKIVMASTGKAVRFFTSDVYAATKKHVEYLSALAARRYPGTAVAATRFTHVVDNSIVGRRIVRWIDEGRPIELHAPDVLLPVQSALECYQLLIAAGIVAEAGILRLVALRDLGWPPIDLLDLALDHLAEQPASPSPITFTGYPRGYEREAYQGTYDPLTAGEVSPLLNCLEAARTRPAAVLGGYVDECWCPDEDCSGLGDLYAAMGAPAARRDDTIAATLLREASELLLAYRMSVLPPGVVARIHALGRHYDPAVADHARIHACVAGRVEARS